MSDAEESAETVHPCPYLSDIFAYKSKAGNSVKLICLFCAPERKELFAFVCCCSYRTRFISSSHHCCTSLVIWAWLGYLCSMTIPEYTPAGCAPITLITQALSHFNYNLSSGPTIHCTVFIIYVVYNVFYLSLWLHCDVIRNFKEHTNALTVIYFLIYLIFTRRIFLVICTMHCFIYFTLWPGFIQKVESQIQEHSRTFLGENKCFQEHFRRVIRTFYLQYYQQSHFVPWNKVAHRRWCCKKCEQWLLS